MGKIVIRKVFGQPRDSKGKIQKSNGREKLTVL